MPPRQQCSLRWNNYFRHLIGALENLRTNDDFVDVSLCCEGRRLKAHKVVLSSCSNYFKELFKENQHPHPMLIFNFIKFDDLKSIVEFMYQGEVVVRQESLRSFIQTAEMLGVQGLIAESKEKQQNPITRGRCESKKLIKSLPSTISATTTPTRTIESFGLNNLSFNEHSMEIKSGVEHDSRTNQETGTHFMVSEGQQGDEEPATELQKHDRSTEDTGDAVDEIQFPTHYTDDPLMEAETEKEEKYVPSDADESESIIDDTGSDYHPQAKRKRAEARSPGNNKYATPLEKYRNHILFQKYFRIVEIRDRGDGRGGVVTQCRFCVKRIRGSIFVTSNFLRHLKSNHLDLFDQYNSAKLNKKSEKSEQGKFEKLLTNFIEQNQLPAEVVQNESFRQLMTFSNSKLNVPNNETPQSSMANNETSNPT